MPKKPPQPVSSSCAAIFASQKSAGKTVLATFVADVLTLNGYALDVFQIDDQKRLSNMLGAKVVDLRPNPDLLIEDPTLLTRAITPWSPEICVPSRRRPPARVISAAMDRQVRP